jgi:hypothetical protein
VRSSRSTGAESTVSVSRTSTRQLPNATWQQRFGLAEFDEFVAEIEFAMRKWRYRRGRQSRKMSGKSGAPGLIAYREKS